MLYIICESVGLPLCQLWRLGKRATIISIVVHSDMFPLQTSATTVNYSYALQIEGMFTRILKRKYQSLIAHHLKPIHFLLDHHSNQPPPPMHPNF